MERRITCIKKDPGNSENHYTEISTLGWIGDGIATVQYSSRLYMYYFIEGGGKAYVMDSKKDKDYLITAVSPKGIPYVKTNAESAAEDNLLQLPECE